MTNQILKYSLKDNYIHSDQGLGLVPDLGGETLILIGYRKGKNIAELQKSNTGIPKRLKEEFLKLRFRKALVVNLQTEVNDQMGKFNPGNTEVTEELLLQLNEHGIKEGDTPCQ